MKVSQVVASGGGPRTSGNRKRSQKEWTQPSEEALGGRGWGAEANAEKWTRHKWTTRRSYGRVAGSISHVEQSETASLMDGEKPCARE